MAEIVTRAAKGRPLTHEEMDGNLTALNEDIQHRALSVHGHLITDIPGLQEIISTLSQPATQASAGLMSAADKTKLDGISDSGGGAFALDDATDVVISTPAAGHLLRYDGTQWANWTPNYLSSNQTVTLSGDASGSGATAITVTLADSGVAAGTYKSVTVDAKGRVTAGTNPTTLAGYGITDALGSTDTAAAASKLATPRSIGMTGDVTWSIPSFDGSGNATAAATLANTGVTAGTYGGASSVPVVTVDAKGRVTSVTTAAISGGGGGGLTNFTEAKTTAAPNATIPVVSLSAIGAETSIDLALVPKGSGALVACIPDSAVAGGNKRGTRAVDLQLSRSLAADVASGAYSVISGGQGNKASGNYSAVSGGSGCISSGATSVVSGGNGNNASGTSSSISGGEYNTASANGAAVVGGANNTASGAHSRASGTMANTRGRIGSTAHARGDFTLAAQYADVLITGTTSGATPAAMSDVIPFSDTLPAVAHCRIRVVAVNSADGNEVKSWTGSVLAYRPSGGSLSLLGTTTLASDAGASALSTAAVTVSANPGPNALQLNVTGVAGKSLQWIAHVEILEKV